MLTVEEARERVLEQAKPLPALRVPLAESLGLVLAEDIASDIDSPPYDKSMMDGYAIRAADLINGVGDLTVLEEIVAGAVPTRQVVPGACSRIMTGAPIPPGADAVVMQEKTQFSAGGDPEAIGRVRIDDSRCRIGQSILPRAASLRRGDVVLKSGRPIGPPQVGLLAEVGRSSVLAIPRVTAAVLSTGNELVPLDQTPSAGQIRNSNGPMLLAAVQQAGAAAGDMGIARDETAILRELLEQGLTRDLLLVSGGVSTGVLDLVPGLLSELGVEQVFHKIRMKPGKPLWFGVRRGAGHKQTLVFGLPGNPVSTYVCFELFVKPAIGRLSGRDVPPMPRTIIAHLARDFTHSGDRPTYHPAVLSVGESGGAATVTLLSWAGSGDLRGLADANALVAFAAGDRQYKVGENVGVLPLE